MKDYEQQDCQLFNAGRFNDIVSKQAIVLAICRNNLRAV